MTDKSSQSQYCPYKMKLWVKIAPDFHDTIFTNTKLLKMNERMMKLWLNTKSDKEKFLIVANF